MTAFLLIALSFTLSGAQAQTHAVPKNKQELEVYVASEGQALQEEHSILTKEDQKLTGEGQDLVAEFQQMQRELQAGQVAEDQLDKEGAQYNAECAGDLTDAQYRRCEFVHSGLEAKKNQMLIHAQALTDRVASWKRKWDDLSVRKAEHEQRVAVYNQRGMKLQAVVTGAEACLASASGSDPEPYAACLQHVFDGGR